MPEIKCPLSAYGQCNEKVEIAQFGSETKSAQKGKAKKYIRCPKHGSMRFDKDTAQEVLDSLVEEGEPNPIPEEIETKPEQVSTPQLAGTVEPSKTMEEWGF